MAYMSLPVQQHQIALDRSVGALEEKRTNGAPMSLGIFPSEARITRLIGAVLVEQGDEWLRVLTLRHMRHGVADITGRQRRTGAPWPAVIKPW